MARQCYTLLVCLEYNVQWCANANVSYHIFSQQVLSRAFRNRFVELHFTEIPSTELEVILHKRCEIPLSYSRKMIGVLCDLQNMRRGSNLFQVSNGCIAFSSIGK